MGWKIGWKKYILCIPNNNPDVWLQAIVECRYKSYRQTALAYVKWKMSCHEKKNGSTQNWMEKHPSPPRERNAVCNNSSCIGVHLFLHCYRPSATHPLAVDELTRSDSSWHFTGLLSLWQCSNTLCQMSWELFISDHLSIPLYTFPPWP